MGVRNFPENCPVCSLQKSETNQASRENRVQEKGHSSPGLWPHHIDPVQRGVHVPGPTTSPSRGARLEPRPPGQSRRSPPSAAGPQSPAAAYSPSRVERGGAR